MLPKLKAYTLSCQRVASSSTAKIKHIIESIGYTDLFVLDIGIGIDYGSVLSVTITEMLNVLLLLPPEVRPSR